MRVDKTRTLLRQGFENSMELHLPHYILEHREKLGAVQSMFSRCLVPVGSWLYLRPFLCPMENNYVYEAEISCDYGGWSRYGVYMILVSYDAGGDKMSYSSVKNSRGIGVLSDPSVKLLVSSDSCYFANLYVHIIPNALPKSALVSASPPFHIKLTVRRNGMDAGEYAYEVNQWGGTEIRLRLGTQ